MNRRLEQQQLAFSLGKDAVKKGFKEPIECKHTIIFLASRKDDIYDLDELTNKEFIQSWKAGWNFEFGQLLMKGYT